MSYPTRITLPVLDPGEAEAKAVPFEKIPDWEVCYIRLVYIGADPVYGTWAPFLKVAPLILSYPRRPGESLELTAVRLSPRLGREAWGLCRPTHYGYRAVPAGPMEFVLPSPCVAVSAASHTTTEVAQHPAGTLYYIHPPDSSWSAVLRVGLQLADESYAQPSAALVFEPGKTPRLALVTDLSQYRFYEAGTHAAGDKDQAQEILIRPRGD